MAGGAFHPSCTHGLHAPNEPWASFSIGLLQKFAVGRPIGGLSEGLWRKKKHEPGRNLYSCEMVRDIKNFIQSPSAQVSTETALWRLVLCP